MGKAYLWLFYLILSIMGYHSLSFALPNLKTQEGDFIVPEFTFHNGEKLHSLKLHYTTLGTPHYNQQHKITNAVMILHGTAASGQQFLDSEFGKVLFTPGGLLDPKRYYIILPDNIGHGKSSKPSDGLHMHFPQYNYQDMVAAQHLLLTKQFKIDHLRLLMGTSMGCMHTFDWAITYPHFSDALMPMACLPVEIGGRNRLWRKIIMDAIEKDPQWHHGEYTSQPPSAMRAFLYISMFNLNAPLPMQKNYPTSASVDNYFTDFIESKSKLFDINDIYYAVNASRDYNPWSSLDKITAPMIWINFKDDFINPPELGIAEKAIKRIPTGQFVLIPLSENTHGHITFNWPGFWQTYLSALLKKTD